MQELGNPALKVLEGPRAPSALYTCNCKPDGPVTLHGEGDSDVDGAAEEGASHRVEERVADHVEEVALGEEVDAHRVDEREGDEAVVQDHQRRQQPVEDAPQLFAKQ